MTLTSGLISRFLCLEHNISYIIANFPQMCLMLDQFLWGHSSRVCDISCYTRIENHDDFHLKTSAIENDAQQSLITILQTSDWTMFKIPVNMQNLIQIYHVFQDL